MYIIDVKNENGTIRAIGLPNNEGKIALVGDFSMQIYRKFFVLKEYKTNFKQMILKKEQYDDYQIVGELGSFEKILIFNMIDDKFKQIFTDFYGKELLEADMFWEKTKSFIVSRKLSFLELSVIHELFREGIAKENIVGFEIQKENQRISFNLTEQSGIDKLMSIVTNSLNHADRYVHRHGHRIIQELFLRLRHA